MKVYLCYLTRTKKEKLVKTVKTFDQAKVWERDMNIKLRELEFLFGKYLISLNTRDKKLYINKDHTVKKSKPRSNYFNFMRDNNFDGTETRSSAYFHEWVVEE